MLRNAHELAAYVRYHNEELSLERLRCSPIGPSGTEPRPFLGRLRRRIGVGLMRIGAVVAGGEEPRGLAARPVWPEFANR